MTKYVYDGQDLADLGVLATSKGGPVFDSAGMSSSLAVQALCHLLDDHHRTGRHSFAHGQDHVSGLEPFLPPDTTTHLAMPLFSGVTPLFAVIATSSDPGYSFDRGDLDFVRGMATVLKAVAIQARAIEVDHKRTRIMSRFSHAMRTPLHSILGSISMLKSSVGNDERAQADELLTTLDPTTREMEQALNGILDQESSDRLDQTWAIDWKPRAIGRRSEGSTTIQASVIAEPARSSSSFGLGNVDADVSPRPRITSQSNLPGATSFLPLDDSEMRATLSIAPMEDDQDPPLTVLVVEDNIISRKLLTMAVKRAIKGCNVIQACDGVEGLTAFCQSRPDLVLTDINMPVMDGIAAAKAMRTVETAQGWMRCPIYAVTGLGQADAKKRRDAMDVTLDGWLVKGQHRIEDIQAIVLKVREQSLKQERVLG